MNIERISFRTTTKERQLLARLNQRYKSRTVTSLFHKLLQDIDDKRLLADHAENPKIPDIFSDIDFDSYMAKEQTAEPENPLLSNPMPAAQKETSYFQRELEKMRIAANNEKVEEKRYDAVDDLLKELADLEKLRDAFRRASPYR